MERDAFAGIVFGALLAAGGAAAQTPAQKVGVELNKLEDQDKG